MIPISSHLSKSVVLNQIAHQDHLVSLTNNPYLSAVLFLIIASLTNYHKLSSQNNTNFLTYSSRGQKSKNLSGWNLKICSFLKDLGEILFPCLFWWLAAAWSQSAGPSFHLRSLQGVAGQTLLVLYRSDTDSAAVFPLPYLKTPVITLGPPGCSGIIQSVD